VVERHRLPWCQQPPHQHTLRRHQQAQHRLQPVASATNAATTTPERGAWPVHDWRVSSPEAQGMDGEHLVQMLEFIHDQQLDLHSVLVAHHGVLVLETYFYPYAADTPHAIYSATKSVSSALVGITIGEGAIPNLDTPMLHFFTDRTIANVDDRKQRITLNICLRCRPAWLVTCSPRLSYLLVLC
jgi:CubicO group peptidase (beta-lactamase class C family)